jgi:hypothetical protein
MSTIVENKKTSNQALVTLYEEVWFTCSGNYAVEFCKVKMLGGLHLVYGVDSFNTGFWSMLCSTSCITSLFNYVFPVFIECTV